MLKISTTYVLMGGIGLLILLLNERIRIAVALVLGIIVILAAADLFAFDLRFWK